MMSEYSPEDRGDFFGWPRATRLPVPDGDLLRHAIMLERCFDGREMRWSDALVARTRRHAGGCLGSAEMSLRMEIAAQRPAIAPLLDALPDALCWSRVQAEPSLLEGGLLGQFRDNAAIGLMQQDNFLSIAEDEAPGSSTEPFPPSIIEDLSALLLAQRAWWDNAADTSPMRLDLPAEMIAEIVWTAGAIIAGALARTDMLPASDIMRIVDGAGSALIARHDEQSSPVTLAALLAHRLREVPIEESQLLYLARGRHILALIAIIADRLGIGLPVAIRTTVECPERRLFDLCRAADFPREVAVRIVLGRKCVARGVDDSMLVEFADRYELQLQSDAVDDVAEYLISDTLRAKLSRVAGAGLRR